MWSNEKLCIPYIVLNGIKQPFITKIAPDMQDKNVGKSGPFYSVNEAVSMKKMHGLNNKADGNHFR